MNYKYVVLDFNKVIVKFTMGDRNITPSFLVLIDIRSIYKDIVV